ncbi:S-adenosyl-L-methionine-dependent methyltransferase [Rhizopogon salebrosus TDB-379]|nr:S-adenosyl-L-methionine-dependent methyltransferase [Rhizopogon salebrosus TDB-379]
MADLDEVKIEALLDIINSSTRQAIAEYKKTGHGVPSADSPTFHPLDLATDTLALKKAIRLLEGSYHQLSSILAPPQHTVYNFAHNYNWACTEVALRARIADVLDKHPGGLNVDELADTVNLDKSNTARILRTLSLMGCFKEVEQDVFANTRVSLILKSTNNAGCTARIVHDFSKYAGVLYETMTDQEFARSRKIDKAPRGFALRKDGIQESYWEMIKNDDEKRDIFHRAMIGHMEIIGAAAVLHQYPWHQVSSVVDIGSGIGAFSMPLAKMFPHLTITNQDLPEAINLAQETWERDAHEALLDGRVEFVAFNFLEDLPVAGQDVYYLANVLHDWPDAEATTILQNIRKVMGQNSRVLIHEMVLFHTVQVPGVQINGLSIAPEPLLPNFGAGSHRVYHQDLGMWFLLNAKERTLDEFKTLGVNAGLAITEVHDLVDTMVMEFRIAQD